MGKNNRNAAKKRAEKKAKRNRESEKKRARIKAAKATQSREDKLLDEQAVENGGFVITNGCDGYMPEEGSLGVNQMATYMTANKKVRTPEESKLYQAASYAQHKRFQKIEFDGFRENIEKYSFYVKIDKNMECKAIQISGRVADYRYGVYDTDGWNVVGEENRTQVKADADNMVGMILLSDPYIYDSKTMKRYPLGESHVWLFTKDIIPGKNTVRCYLEDELRIIGLIQKYEKDSPYGKKSQWGIGTWLPIDSEQGLIVNGKYAATPSAIPRNAQVFAIIIQNRGKSEPKAMLEIAEKDDLEAELEKIEKLADEYDLWHVARVSDGEVEMV